MSTPIHGSLAAAFAKSADGWFPGVPKPPGPVNNLTQPILPNAQPAPQGAAAGAPTPPKPATPTAQVPGTEPAKIAPQQPQQPAKPTTPVGPAAAGGLAAAYSPQAWAASQGYRLGEVKPAPPAEPYVAPTTYTEYGGQGGPVQRQGTRVVMPQPGAEAKAGPDDGRDAAVTKPTMSRERMYSQLGIPGGFIPPAAPSVYVSPDIDVNTAPKPTPSTGGSYGRVAPVYDPNVVTSSGLAQSYATDAAIRDSTNQMWDDSQVGQAWNWLTKRRGDIHLHNRYDPIRGGFAKEEDVPKIPISYLDVGLAGAPALAAGGRAVGKAIPSLFPRAGMEAAAIAEELAAARAAGAAPTRIAELEARLAATKVPPTTAAPTPAAPAATPKTPTRTDGRWAEVDELERSARYYDNPADPSVAAKYKSKADALRAELTAQETAAAERAAASEARWQKTLDDLEAESAAEQAADVAAMAKSSPNSPLGKAYAELNEAKATGASPERIAEIEARLNGHYIDAYWGTAIPTKGVPRTPTPAAVPKPPVAGPTTEPLADAAAPKPVAPAATPKPVESAPPVVEDYQFNLWDDLRGPPKPPPTSGKPPGVPLHPDPPRTNPARAGAASDLPVKPPIPKPGQPVVPKPAAPAAPVTPKGMPTTTQPNGLADAYGPAGVFDTTPVAKSPRAVEPPGAPKAKPGETPAALPAPKPTEPITGPPAGTPLAEYGPPAPPKTMPPGRTGDDAFQAMQGGDYAKTLRELGEARARNAPAADIAALKAKLDAIKNRSSAVAPKAAEPPADAAFGPVPVPVAKAPAKPPASLPEPAAAPKGNLSDKLPAPKAETPAPKPADPFAAPGEPVSIPIAPRTQPITGPTAEPLAEAAGASPKTVPPKAAPKPAEPDPPWAKEIPEVRIPSKPPLPNPRANGPRKGSLDPASDPEYYPRVTPGPRKPAPDLPDAMKTQTGTDFAASAEAARPRTWLERHPSVSGAIQAGDLLTGTKAVRHAANTVWNLVLPPVGRSRLGSALGQTGQGVMAGMVPPMVWWGIDSAVNPDKMSPEQWKAQVQENPALGELGAMRYGSPDPEYNNLFSTATSGPKMLARTVTGQRGGAVDYLRATFGNVGRGLEELVTKPITAGNKIVGFLGDQGEKFTAKEIGDESNALVQRANLQKEYAAATQAFHAAIANNPESEPEALKEFLAKDQAIREQMSKLDVEELPGAYADQAMAGQAAERRNTAKWYEANKQKPFADLVHGAANGNQNALGPFYTPATPPDQMIPPYPTKRTLDRVSGATPDPRYAAQVDALSAKNEKRHLADLETSRQQATLGYENQIAPPVGGLGTDALMAGTTIGGLMSGFGGMNPLVGAGMATQRPQTSPADLERALLLQRADDEANLPFNYRMLSKIQRLKGPENPDMPEEPTGKALADALGEDAKKLLEMYGERGIPEARQLATESVAGNINAMRLALASGFHPGFGGMAGELAANSPDVERQNPLVPFGGVGAPPITEAPYIFRESQGPAQGATPAAQPWLGAMAPATPWAEGSPHDVAAAGLARWGGDAGAATWKGEDGKPAPATGVIPKNQDIPPEDLEKGKATAAAAAAALAGAHTSEAAKAVLDRVLNAAEPPPGFKGYWSRLPDTSKILAIAGVSLAGISLLRSMFGSGKKDDEEEDEGFLMKALPFIGIGAAAWGLGGGTFSSLPEMKHYNRFIGGVTSNLGSLGDAYTGTATPAAK